jgi:7-cyano-7-deazaguanine synthase
MKKDAVVIHSGGMDSSLCLALAIREYGAGNVLSMSFSYGQRHSNELTQAAKICREWDVDHIVIDINSLQEITTNALMDKTKAITLEGGTFNTLVVGRNGLMMRLGAIHAHSLEAHCIYAGVMGLEAANSGYRDCSREYIDLIQTIMRMDLGEETFEVRTPLVDMTKKESMYLGYELGVLKFLLAETITCYNGIRYSGCKTCPACLLRNEGIRDFCAEVPAFVVPRQYEENCML